MNRRLFLQFPLMASALLSEAKGFSKDRPNKGFKVEANKGRYQEELLIMGGHFGCKVNWAAQFSTYRPAIKRACTLRSRCKTKTLTV